MPTEGDAISQHWLLPIPARLQWENEHGFCGETSMQSIGLYYGVWNSQHVIRSVGGGETLIGVNAAPALTALHFQHEEWQSGQGVPHFQDFMVWLKTHLAQATPVMMGTYLSDMEDPDYDHIVPVTGVHAHTPNPSVFDPLDRLVFNTNLSTTPTTVVFGKLGLNRAQCSPTSPSDGCIPMEYDYGIAVKGIADASGTSRPLRMEVDAVDEPNITLGKSKRRMQAKVHAANLTPGKTYALLRYNDYKKVPTSGNAQQWLAAAYDGRLDFKAAAREWSYTDQDLFDSDGSLYYRCVEVP